MNVVRFSVNVVRCECSKVLNIQYILYVNVVRFSVNVVRFSVNVVRCECSKVLNIQYILYVNVVHTWGPQAKLSLARELAAQS